MNDDADPRMTSVTSSYRQVLRRVPGLRSLYRAARRAWWGLRDGATNAYWRARGALLLRGRGKRRVTAVWGPDARGRERVRSGDATGWLDSVEVLRSYVFPQFGGMDWHDYLAQRWGTRRALGLSLCCGDGEPERNLLRHNVCDSFEGIDISEEAVRVCRERAAAAGLAGRLSYRVGDVEASDFGRDRYDLVVAWMALHHLRRLGGVFRAVRRALKPEGIFVVNEYVGPARFQVPDRQVAVINSLLTELPEELRREAGGGMKEQFSRPQLAEIINHDPSEAVCSHRILPLLRRSFEVVDCVQYGGTILNWLLYGIVQNFQPDNAAHQAALQRLYEAERAALAGGAVASDFAFVVAKLCCSPNVRPAQGPSG